MLGRLLMNLRISSAAFGGAGFRGLVGAAFGTGFVEGDGAAFGVTIRLDLDRAVDLAIRLVGVRGPTPGLSHLIRVKRKAPWRVRHRSIRPVFASKRCLRGARSPSAGGSARCA